jgi:hypothetical protein
MHASDTYQAILDEGQAKAMREMILILGEDRFGPPNEPVRAGLQSITDLDWLLRIVRQKAASWQEILNTP